MQRYYFGGQVKAKMHQGCCHPLLQKMWRGFCFRAGEIAFEETDELVFVLGDEAPPALDEKAEYALCVTEHGAAVRAESREALCRGYFDLLRAIRAENLEAGSERFYLEARCEQKVYDIAVRMVHLCVFPETSLTFLKKTVRLCAVLHYTHVILEFWGMLQYDCLKELAWPMAYTKAQAKEVIDEIRALGMEPVPMFNHLGHAAGSRLKYGKHVVLDQNPRLQTYFGEDAWTWNAHNPKTVQLLQNVRRELYDLFGPGEYVHIGIDEAYKYSWDVSLADTFAAFLGDLTDKILLEEGRRPIIWGDMLLNKATVGVENSPDRYFCLCKDQRIADTVFERLDRRVIIADWQYWVYETPVKTVPYLKEKGFDVLTCPWDNIKNVKACVDTARSEGILGFMDTTWHTLCEGFNGIYTGAYHSDTAHADEALVDKHAQLYDTAAIFRKVADDFEGYENCGWKREQIEY